MGYITLAYRILAGMIFPSAEDTIERNLEFLCRDSREEGSFSGCVWQSIRSSGGFCEGHPCAAVDFSYNPTGRILYCASTQVPKQFRARRSVMQVALDIDTEKFRIIYPASSDDFARDVLCATFKQYNERFGV